MINENQETKSKLAIMIFFERHISCKWTNMFSYHSNQNFAVVSPFAGGAHLTRADLWDGIFLNDAPGCLTNRKGRSGQSRSIGTWSLSWDSHRDKMSPPARAQHPDSPLSRSTPVDCTIFSKGGSQLWRPWQKISRTWRKAGYTSVSRKSRSLLAFWLSWSDIRTNRRSLTRSFETLFYSIEEARKKG